MSVVKVFGTGCPKCVKLFELAERAVKELGLDAQVLYVDDINEIARMTVITPAMAVNDKLVMTGLRPYPTVKEVLQKELA